MLSTFIYYVRTLGLLWDQPPANNTVSPYGITIYGCIYVTLIPVCSNIYHYYTCELLFKQKLVTN